MRLLTLGCLSGLLFSLSACGPSDPANAGTGGGSGGANAGAGAPAGNAGSPPVGSSGGAPAGSSGAPATSGGSTPGGGAAPIVNTGGAGGGDDGGLFTGPGVVPVVGAGGGGGSGGGIVVGGPGAGKGTAHIGGSASGTAAFTTQPDGSVQVVVSLSSCPNGTIGIFVMDGDSCDNNGTEGGAWDGKRGNIGDTGAITCSNGKASLMYTRAATDPAMKWTVGDHSATDVTFHVVIVTSSSSVTSSHIACGNFFS
jgi:hypothetical protein